jgi:hypothetical protein
MPAAARRAAVILNGIRCKVKEGTAKFAPGGRSGEPVMSDDGECDTSYTNKPCMLEFTHILTPGHKVSQLKVLQDAEGTFTWLDTGESWVLTFMTASGGGEWQADGDGMPMKFHGAEAQPA